MSSTDTNVSSDVCTNTAQDLTPHNSNRMAPTPRLDSEKTAPPPRLDSDTTLADFGPAPDGRFRAWSVAVGGFCVTFAALGFASSFGVFQEYYITHQLRHKTADDIAWIGSCNAFLQFVAGSVAGPLFDRYGARLVLPSAVACIVAIMMVSLCREYYQFVLAQGILLGTAVGCMQFPAMAAVGQFFDKKRAAALGLTIAGSSVGGVVFPIAASRMLNDPRVAAHLSFGWAVRILGFVMLVALAVAVATIRPRLPPRTTHFFLVGAFRKPDYLCIVVSLFFSFTAVFTPLFFLPSYAVSRGMDAALASDLLAIVNAASTLGRIIPGMLADRFGRINVLAIGGLATGITILCLTCATSTPGLVVYAVFFGFASGTIVSGAAAAMAGCVDDARDLGTYMGMGLGTASVAVLIGPPINGALLHRSGAFLHPTIFSGVMCIVGSVVAVVAKKGTKAGVFGRA